VEVLRRRKLEAEVIAVGLHLQVEPMNTLIDTHATLDAGGNFQGGSGFRCAHTSVFAMETAAVHAGPGSPHVKAPALAFSHPASSFSSPPPTSTRQGGEASC